MKKYKVKIAPIALADIQEITDWYNVQQPGLGKRFLKTAIFQINSLSKDPQICAIFAINFTTFWYVYKYSSLTGALLTGIVEGYYEEKANQQ